MITEDKLIKIKENLNEFKKTLPEDIEYLDVYYDNGLHIKFINNITNNARYLFIKQSDYVLNKLNHKRRRFYNEEQKFMQPDLYDEKIIEKFQDCVSKFVPKIDKNYDATKIDLPIYNDIGYYKTENSVLVKTENSLAEFRNNQLVDIDNIKDKNKAIQAYENYLAYNNKEDFIYTTKKILMKENKLSNMIKNTKEYKKQKRLLRLENSKWLLYTLLSFGVVFLIAWFIIFYLPSKIIITADDEIMFLPYVTLRALSFTVIPLVSIKFLQDNQSMINHKYPRKRKKQLSIDYSKNNKTDIEGYIDLNINKELMDKYNLNIENKVQLLPDMEVNLLKTKNKDINEKLKTTQQYLSQIENDIENEFYISNLNKMLKNYELVNDKTKDKIKENIDLINELLKQKTNKDYIFEELEVKAINQQLKERLKKEA